VPQNLLVISIDTLRLDRIGFFAQTDTTPFLDGRLRKSAVLTDLRGCSNWTYSSLLCLFSGQSTVELGFEPVTSDPAAEAPPEELPGVPLWLQEAGYQTAVVTGSPFLTTDPGVVTGGGFQTIVYDDWGNAADFPDADWVVEQGVEQVERLMETPESPWMLQLHFMDPHTPFSAPESYRKGHEDLAPIPYDLTSAEDYGQAQRDYAGMSQEERDLLVAHIEMFYLADLRFLDEWLGTLWDQLDALGALEDTLVMFWTDHGEQHYEHNRIGHSQALYQEENRALAAFWAPGIESGPLPMPAMHQDLWPTVFNLLQIPQQSSTTGLGLANIADDRLRTAFRYQSTSSARLMVTRSDKVLLYASDGRKAFYDAATDPLELTDLYDAKDADVIALWDDMDQQIDDVLTYLPHLVFEDRGP